MGTGGRLILRLKLRLRLEHAVANYSYPDAVSGFANESEVVSASLCVTLPAPHFAVADLRIGSASQRWVEWGFLRDWRLLLV